MHLSLVLLCLCLGSRDYAAASDWCYSGCEHTPSHWSDISGAFCGGEKQSPIDIDTSDVQTDHNLKSFTLANFSSQNIIKSIINNGHTVKAVMKDDAAEVSGGGLKGVYSTVQFHLHWGDTEHHPGSEHTFDGHRYQMEMHIVNLKKGVEEPTKDPEGIAVLGFFINATEDGDFSEPWSKLASHLTNIQGSEVNFNDTVSINDLIKNVNLSKFYRYKGSLTTPNCNEAVVWTVFHEPINIHKDLIQMFPIKTGLSNVYRPTQNTNGRQVYASPAAPFPPSHPWCYDDHCDYDQPDWHLLPQSFCDGKRQSPIDIDTDKTEIDKQLTAFTFKNFDDKRVIKHMMNTGHTVKCVLKEDLLVSGGGLGHDYTPLQLHFHWGPESQDSEGSEHTVDSHRYAMEMHIVTKRKDLSLEQAIRTSNGLAVLGVFMEAADSDKSSGGSAHHETPEIPKPTSNTEAWKKLTNYLSQIKNISSQATVTEEISIDDLLGGLDRTAYYRYNGSLTTPTCNEAVVWTVFKKSIKVDKDMMMRFLTMGYHNVYRSEQSLHDRKILSTESASSVPGPVTLFLLLSCLCALFVTLPL